MKGDIKNNTNYGKLLVKFDSFLQKGLNIPPSVGSSVTSSRDVVKFTAMIISIQSTKIMWNAEREMFTNICKPSDTPLYCCN